MRALLVLAMLLSIGCIQKNENGSNVEPEVKQGAVEAGMSKGVGVDVRSLAEVQENPAPGSVHIEMGDIAEKFGKEFPLKSVEISIFCEVGGRAEKAREFLVSKGYTNIKNIGSWRDWNKMNAK